MQTNTCPGPYNYDDDEDYVPTKKVKYSFRDDNPAAIKKHTLDSDEEDEDADEKEERKKYDVLKDEDIDGQEEATIDMEGETKITPFNMKEEMEEGHFDKDGFYHFKKDADLLKDAWLDNIDWVKVKQQGDEIKKYGSDVDSDSDTESRLPPSQAQVQKERESIMALYNDIFPYLREGESIAKALKRLGGDKKRLSSAERWKLKKQGKLDEASGRGGMEDFMKLTELANGIINTGNMDVYQETYEMIRLKMRRFEESLKPSEAAMDMFSDSMASNVSTTNGRNIEDQAEHSTEKDSFDEVKWEFRWDNKDEATIHGPFSTEQMIKWKESNYFKTGVYVRKTSEKSGPWYHSSRLDFDLYV